MRTLCKPRPNSITHGDCIDVMSGWSSASVDLIVTDPPYLVRYKDRSGRSILNDESGEWLAPAFAEMYRLLKPGSFCVSFYGWNSADQFMAAWRTAGFRIVGHLVFCKPYASSRRFLRYQHEMAYLLAKGDARKPASPMPDVLKWSGTGNRLHPTQKPVSILKPIIRSFSAPGAIVLDPFCGSGSTLMAATRVERRYLGIELDAAHFRTASRRMQSPPD